MARDRGKPKPLPTFYRKSQISMMNGSNIVNCTPLETRSSFPAYIQALRDDQAFNTTLLEACKPQVCNALWGTGNADISGIGMIFGYLLEHFLGFSLALGLEFIRSTKQTTTNYSPWRKKFRTAVLRGSSVFFDCAVYFAASIQIACIVVLVRKDFGISANGLGELTVQITWAVALLSLLPLLYPLVMLSVRLERSEEPEEEEATSSRHGVRFYLFCACWCLSLYTFISKMIGDFAPSQVGEGKGEKGTTIVSGSEWEMVTALCFAGIQQLSDGENRVIEAFGAAGSIILSLFVICPFLWDIMHNSEIY